jgi:methyl-accepting chemotaxis protein
MNRITAEPSTALDLDEIEAKIDLIIAGKYLSVTAGDDRLGRKLKALAEAMHARVRGELLRVVDMSINGNEAVTAAAEMSRAMREVDGRAHSISAAAEEMVASVQEISRNSDDVAADTEQARGAANDALVASENAIRAMEAVTRAVEDAAGKVENLAEASSKIGEIVQQIEAIAKQTNLLALNATIEAARAGEAGKGFAVVANEVKHLASQTGRATEDIRARIEGLRTEMGAIVTSMEDGAKAVEEGREVISGTGDNMRTMVGLIENVTTKMHDVAAILGQQNQASAEISSGITTIARMSADNVETIHSVLDVMDRADGLIQDAVTRLGEAEIADFTVHVAKSDHMIWRKRLAQMVAGRTSLDAKELADHHSCRLGKWYDALKDPSITGHPAYKALAGPHRDVHAAGIEATRLYNDGDLDGAMVKIREAAEASVHVMRYLDDLARR